MDQYGNIRRAHRDGMSIRDIARTFHHSRRKIRQILQEPQPRSYTRSSPPRLPFQALSNLSLTPSFRLTNWLLPSNVTPPPRSSVASARNTTSQAATTRFAATSLVSAGITARRSFPSPTIPAFAWRPISAQLAREAAEANEDYEQYQLRLTELEVAARGANAMAARIRQADFPCRKTSTPSTSASCRD